MTTLRTITALVRRARQALAEGRTTYAVALIDVAASKLRQVAR